jgi:hypothetical protein
MTASDTTPEAAAVQTAIHRHLAPAARLKLAIEMSDFLRDVALAGTAARHPHASAAELSAAMIHELYGVRVSRT